MVDDRACTPVLGSGLADRLLPSREEIARRWATGGSCPWSARAGELAKVAQSMQVRTSAETPRTELRTFMRAEFLRRWGDRPDAAPGPSGSRTCCRAVAALHRADVGDDPYAVVADLDLPVYVTTSWTACWRRRCSPATAPVVRSFAWHRGRVDVTAPLDFDPDNPERPCDYHLFGRIEDPDSIALSEDDYFTWSRRGCAGAT